MNEDKEICGLMVEDVQPPFIDSELDFMKYDNNDISLDEAVAKSGGHFFVCNASVLNAKW